MAKKILPWLLRHPLGVGLMLLVITLFFGWQIPKLNVKTTIYDLIIEDLPATTEYRAFQKTFGSDEIIRVVLRGQNVLDAEFFAKLSKTSTALEKVKGVGRVISLDAVKKAIDPQAELSLARFEKMLAPAKLFYQNLIADDHKATAITLVLNDEAQHEGVIAEVTAILDALANDAASYQIGIPLVSEALVDYSKHDLVTILPLCALAIVIILYGLYRNFWFLFLPIAGLLLALVWTTGMAALVGIPLSMLTMIVPVFIIAVGTAYSLHIFSAHRKNVQTAANPPEAVYKTFGHLSLPTILAVITTAIGLGSLMVNRITAIREFALLSGFGLFSLAVILLLFLPVALARIPLARLSGRGFEFIDTFMARFINLAVRINLRSQRITFTVVAFVMVISVASLFFIRVETSPVSYFKKSTSISRNFHAIQKNLSGSFPVNIVVASKESDYFEAPEAFLKLARLQDFATTLPKVDKSISAADYMRLVNYILNNYDPKFYMLPQKGYQVRRLLNNYKTILGEDMLYRFIDKSFASANILLLTHLDSSREFLETRQRILEFGRENWEGELSVSVTGIGMAIAESSHKLVTGQIQSLGLSMAIVFTIMFVLFLSARVGLVAIVTNLFPIAVSFGIMGIFGIELNMATGLIASIAIGLAVDDTIHYLVRYNREFKKDLDKDRALKDTLKSVGAPMLFTTITIGAGFGLLLLSHFAPTAIFGFLLMVTMLAALMGDMVVLPSIMRHVELVTAWDLLRLMPQLGGLAPGTAHELVQPLTAIKIGNDFVKTMLQKGRDISTDQLSLVVNEVGTQVDRATAIIQRLRALGENTGLAPELIQIEDCIDETVGLLRNQLALDDISIELDLGENLPAVYGHRQRFSQVFYNLLTNSAEAINKRGQSAPAEKRKIIIHTEKASKEVVVKVTDTGIGLSRQMRERVWEPFFTTQAAGQGKGLGLAITSEIIRNAKGRIKMQSTAGEGATVVIAFPIAAKKSV
jgi:uncharacterized protein